ncbi:hypothetical protein [Cupriavidus necator]|uniref:hypothetical protein n=1 Tax=Cupriavidus necator TaxID=106590 RepID=UPI00129E5A89|nr:hypothetical protein [Cupriavidus necator]
MRKPIFYLLLSFPLVMAGCKSTPSNSDIENSIKSYFAGCKNVEIDDVKKTNGFDDDGNYRVEFTYTINVNKDGLKKLKTLYLEDKDKEEQYIKESKIIEGQIREAEDRKQRVFEEQVKAAPRYPNSGDPSIRREYEQAYGEWLRSPEKEGFSQRQAEIEKEIDKMKESLRELGNQLRPSANWKSNSFGIIYSYYSQGCPNRSSKFMSMDVLKRSEQEFRTSNDFSALFNGYETPMSASMAMRKTEQGWRIIQ